MTHSRLKKEFKNATSPTQASIFISLQDTIQSIPPSLAIKLCLFLLASTLPTVAANPSNDDIEGAGLLFVLIFVCAPCIIVGGIIAAIAMACYGGFKYVLWDVDNRKDEKEGENTSLLSGPSETSVATNHYSTFATTANNAVNDDKCEKQECKEEGDCEAALRPTS